MILYRCVLDIVQFYDILFHPTFCPAEFFPFESHHCKSHIKPPVLHLNSMTIDHKKVFMYHLNNSLSSVPYFPPSFDLQKQHSIQVQSNCLYLPGEFDSWKNCSSVKSHFLAFPWIILLMWYANVFWLDKLTIFHLRMHIVKYYTFPLCCRLFFNFIEQIEILNFYPLAFVQQIWRKEYLT